MIITIPAPRWPPNGPRPINLSRDVPQVVELLELAFGEKMDRDGQSMIRYGNPEKQPAFLWRFSPLHRRLAPGYVWQADDRIVGNVTLIGTKDAGRHIIANVAVHPDFRRQGIAKALMDAVMEQVRARHGEVVMLQVVRDNSAAIDLYKTLGFDDVGSMTSWRAPISRLREIPPSTEERKSPLIRPLRRRQWQEAYAVEVEGLHPDLNWPQPLQPDYYRTGFWKKLNNLLNARQQEVWVATDKNQRVVALGSILGEWGRPYQLSIRVQQQWRGYLERPLLAKLIRRLRQMSRRNTQIIHTHDDQVMNQLLREANFSPRRTLTHMRWDVYYDKPRP